MNTTQYLAQFGITIEQARSFIMANMATPINIYNAALQYKIDSKMLAEIVAPQFPGLTHVGVEQFFDGLGLKGETLNPLAIDFNPNVLLWMEQEALAPLYSFNNNTGILSTESLRSAITAKIGTDKYNSVFDVKFLPGSADGVLSTTDLGFTHLGDIQATMANYESLYYGTLINATRHLSVRELWSLLDYVDANRVALEAEDRDVVAPTIAFLTDAYKDPVDDSDPAYFNDDQIAAELTAQVMDEVLYLGVPQHDSLLISLIVF
jgi:hypothetical protein